LLGYWVGRTLVERNAELAAREADFNRSLARVNENIDAISLASGEASEARRIETALDSLLAAMRSVVTNLTNFSWVSSGYTVFTRVAPAVAGAVLYFSGRLSVGGFAIASLAFVQLQSSLRWFIDNFHKMAKWRESLERVANFRRIMIVGDAADRLESRIAIADGEAGKIVVENLSISSPSGTSVSSEERLEIVSGERLLIVAAGDLPVLLALAGLWPWGSGRIARPKTEEIVYLPRMTYLPHGTLREVLAYPSRFEDFRGAELFPGVLVRLGMNRLIPLLDSTQRWDQVLSEDERHCVGFARAMELIITGRRIDVREAERIGLVNEIVPRGKALDRATELAHEIAALPQGAIRSDKESVMLGVGRTLEERLRIEAEMTISMFMRRDSHTIGAGAFKRGERPEWPHHGL